MVPSLRDPRILPAMATTLQGWVPHVWDHRLWGFILAAILSFGIQGSTAQDFIIPVPNSPVMGGVVVLTIPDYSTTITSVNWYRGKQDARQQQYNVIVTYIPGSNERLGPKSTGREKVLPNGSLQITNLMASDMGDYTVEINILNSGPRIATVNLMVSDRTVATTQITAGPAQTTAITTGSGVLPTSVTAGDPAKEKKSSTGVIIGAVVGGIIAVALATIGAVILHKRLHNSKKRPGRTKPIVLPRSSPSVKSDGYIDPIEINLPPNTYETVLPFSTNHGTSPPFQTDQIYEELRPNDQHVYNQLQK